MARTVPLRIGANTSCTDGARGEVSRIIVNPAAREVTHLVVEPEHRHGPARFVPIDLVDTATSQTRLRCTLAEFQALQPAQEAESVRDLDPTGHGHPYYAPGDRLQMRYQMLPHNPAKAPQQVTVDSVPSGEVGIRRELTVCGTDDEIGQVRGLLVEPGGHQITHVLLQEGHVLGRKEVAIPIGAVTKFGTMMIHLSLTKHQVGNLPPVDIDHPAE